MEHHINSISNISLTYQSFIAILIFLSAYIFIATEKINKTIIALLGASAMVGLHLIHSKDVFKYIDFNVIFLLIGMMIIAEVVGKTGLFEFVGAWIAKKAKGNPIKIIIWILSFHAFTSAFLDNVTTAILIVPITLAISQQLEINPTPILILEAIVGNIGGTATLIGDPPNLLIGSARHLSFMDFIKTLAPPVIVMMIVLNTILYFLFRNKLKVSIEAQARLKNLNPKAAIKDKKFFIQSLSVLLGTILLFFVHEYIDIEASFIALFGASIILLIDKDEPEELFKNLEWSTILFFAGLFIMVGTLEELGVLKYISEKLIDISGNSLLILTFVILWGAAIISAIVDNIPLVAALIPMLKHVEESSLYSGNIEVIWWALALGACLGGVATIIGASDNVIIVQMAKKNGYEISFGKFAKYGVPSMILVLLISSLYLYIRFF